LGGGVRAGYECLAGLGEVLDRVRELSAQTVVFDIEPLVAYWDSGQEALDQGIALVLSRVAAVPGVQVVCFATNSLRRPTGVPGAEGVRVVYLASAGKPLRVAAYRGFPRPGVVIGDQVATDGILARRLGYSFVLYRPPGRLPAGPQLMNRLGRLVRPLLFTRAG
jgi:predicted HAD superfamily phosphohydrolase YqeG